MNDEPLQRMFHMLYAKVNIPSPTTLSCDVKEVHNLAKLNVAKVLQVAASEEDGSAVNNKYLIFRVIRA